MISKYLFEVHLLFVNIEMPNVAFAVIASSACIVSDESRCENAITTSINDRTIAIVCVVAIIMAASMKVAAKAMME